MLHTELKSRLDEDICLLFQPENHARKYLCDCGFASGLTVADCHDIEAIFVSHTHIDHFIGFNLIARHQLAIGRRVVVVGPEGIARNVQAQLRSFNWNLLTVDDQAVWYEVREVHGGGQLHTYELRSPRWELQRTRTEQTDIVFENEAFSARYTALDHGIPTLAYLFSEPDKLRLLSEKLEYPPGKWVKSLKNAYLNGLETAPIEVEPQRFVPAGELFALIERTPGYRLGYIMDHRASPENHDKICALFDHADEVYIEAYYREEERDFADKNKHSTALQSGCVARRAHIRKPVPTHFSRRYQQGNAHQELLDEFWNAFRG